VLSAPVRSCHDEPVTTLGVLGPLLVTGPTGSVRIGSARQRRLLVALAAHAGRVVDTELLVELVWDAGERVPTDPAGAVQTNVSRLRRVLPPEVGVVTAARGYQLLADRAALDVSAFTDRLAAAATAEPAGRPERYEAALALWRGRPFAELDHPVLAPEIARLVERHAAASEQHASALLAAGRVGEAVAALEAIVAAEPLREGAVALLVRALVAGGRQTDALAALARSRARLADELGLDPAPQLQQLQRQVLRQEILLGSEPVAPLPGPTPPARRPGLPVSSFVGRDRELGAVTALLGVRRVVTLCGPGGVGKTRLALHVAASVADRYDDGVLVVELGEVAPGQVEAAFAGALRLPGGVGALAERIVEVLAVRRQLVVVDNCEHVADEAAALVEALARAATGVDLLLTGREPLRVDGEQVVVIEPLPLDAATTLLAERLASAACPAPDADLLPELCRRLDGLPLAIELAASRAAALGVRGLLDALDSADPVDAVGVLRGGRRTAAARHRSLADVVAWSHGLLDPPQQALFERLAVFAAAVERDAVAAVCGDVSALPDLVQRSLVVRHPGVPDRFGMLETLRAFGRSRLARDPDAAALRARHAAWAVALAGEIGAARQGAGEAAAVHRFDAHLPDLRRAHGWLCAHGPAGDLLRLAVLFAELAYVRGRVDLVGLAGEALAAVHVPGPGTDVTAMHPLVPRLLGLLATSGWQRGDLAAAEDMGRRAVALAEAAGDPTGARHGHEALSNVASFRGDLAAAMHHARSARELARAAGDLGWELLALVDLAVPAGYAGDPAVAEHEAALAELAARLGSPTARAWLAYVRGEIRAERGDPTASGHLAAAVAAAQEADSAFIAGVARHTLCTAAARDGDPAAALPAFGPLVDHWHGVGAWTQLWIAVRALVETLSRLGRHRDATVLLAAMAASPRAAPVHGADCARLDAVRERARTVLGAGFDDAQRDGAALPDQGAVALVRRLTRS